MFEFFDTIINFISTLVDFTVNLVESIMIVISQIGSGLVLAGAVIIYLPEMLMAFALAIIGYCIVVNLINKGG